MNAGKEVRRAEVAMVDGRPSLSTVARQEETAAAAKVSSGAIDEDGDGIVDAVEVLE